MLSRISRAVRRLLRESAFDSSSRLLPSLSSLQQDQWLTKEAIGYLTEEALGFLDPRSRDPRYLGRFAAKMFSQNYEDAIVAEIFSRVGEGSRRFMEIGSGDGQENCTRYLLLLGWSGAWIEADANNVDRAQSQFPAEIAEGRLVVGQSAVTAENINAITVGLSPQDEIDFLAIDIDQNTSHVWRALNVNSRVACIEYNAALPPSLPFEVPYRPDATWDGSNLYGASLKSLESIGAKKGMSLVGCDPHGVNAFFVRNDLLGDYFLQPYTAEQHYQPARYSLSRPRGHSRLGPPVPNFTMLPGQPRLTRLSVEGVPETPFVVHGAEDLYISDCLIKTGKMEPLETRIFVEMIPRVAGFFDIGANIGYYSVLASKLRPFGFPIVAVEPNAANVSLLRANLRLAKAQGQVAVVEAAVSGSVGKAELYLSNSNFGDHRLNQAPGENRSREPIETTTLESLFNSYPEIDLVKIDTQGAEAAILLAAKGKLRTRQKQVILVFEFCPSLLAIEAAQSLLGMLDELELQLFDINEDSGTVSRTSSGRLRTYLASCQSGGEPRNFTNVLATQRPDAIAVLDQLMTNGSTA